MVAVTGTDGTALLCTSAPRAASARGRARTQRGAVPQWLRHLAEPRRRPRARRARRIAELATARCAPTIERPEGTWTGQWTLRRDGSRSGKGRRGRTRPARRGCVAAGSRVGDVQCLVPPSPLLLLCLFCSSLVSIATRCRPRCQPHRVMHRLTRPPPHRRRHHHHFRRRRRRRRRRHRRHRRQSNRLRHRYRLRHPRLVQSSRHNRRRHRLRSLVRHRRGRLLDHHPGRWSTPSTSGSVANRMPPCGAQMALSLTRGCSCTHSMDGRTTTLAPSPPRVIPR